ncbi:glutamate 5-kinase [Thelephora ganbajun]|uniref:Glutamate 5-kinase n=1 Tax=Thelephora ganbajun TaxID=370292 RepID=A0ACB6ZXC8_THEGA|nr:glutamate 5-kinase [Thelephora ganbajun]
MSSRNRGPTSTIVIKLGTSSIVHETTHQPLLSTLSRVVETVVRLKSQGHKVVLVSSGAIGVGLKRMEIPSRPKSLSGKQALAAIGQGRLIALWDNLFGQLGQPIAQVLLTRGDISDRTRYLNAVNTFKELLSMGVVPIVNENDTISVSEIKFGDNDTLSAITSSMVHADYLFLLTDVDGLYLSNPRKDPDAKFLEVVSSVAEARSEVSTATLGSNLGTGGMETKLIAAEIATEAGVNTIIASSKDPENVQSIIEYHAAVSIPGVDPSTIPRPKHTLFKPSLNPMRDMKSWTSHTLFPAGTVVIDTGAHVVLSRKESGGRLLPVGVIGIKGSFASHQAVRICVRAKIDSPGVVGTAQAEEDPEAAVREYARGIPTSVLASAPATPTIGSRTTSSSDLTTLTMGGGAYQSLYPSNLNLPSVIEEDQVVVLGDSDPIDSWQLVEVGRGLANYNSEQIDKVKRMNSSSLSKVLGYADSDYVVENITIRIPP